jgi:hypothetical protein
MRVRTCLPTRFPTGTKYILEGRGPFVRRYVEFPDGRRMPLELRKALTCNCAAWQEIGIVPVMRPVGKKVPPRRKFMRAAISLPWICWLSRPLALVCSMRS